jgi:hypothetical protein
MANMANALGPMSGRGPRSHPLSIVVSSCCYVLAEFSYKGPSIQRNWQRRFRKYMYWWAHSGRGNTRSDRSPLPLFASTVDCFRRLEIATDLKSDWGWKLINLVRGFLFCLAMLLTTALLVARPCPEVSTIIHESMMWWPSILVRLSLWLFSQLGFYLSFMYNLFSSWF